MDKPIKYAFMFFLFFWALAENAHHEHYLPSGTYHIKYIKETFPNFQRISFIIDEDLISFHGCNMNSGSYELSHGHQFAPSPYWIGTKRACPLWDYDSVVL